MNLSEDTGHCVGIRQSRWSDVGGVANFPIRFLRRPPLVRQVPGFHKNQAALRRERLMDAQVRISKPGPCRVSLMLVFEDTFNNEDLLASEMTMSVEVRPRSPANERRVAVPGAVEWTDIESAY